MGGESEEWRGGWGWEETVGMGGEGGNGRGEWGVGTCLSCMTANTHIVVNEVRVGPLNT